MLQLLPCPCPRGPKYDIAHGHKHLLDMARDLSTIYESLGGDACQPNRFLRRDLGGIPRIGYEDEANLMGTRRSIRHP